MDKLKKIIIVIVIALLLGAFIFFILYIFTDVFNFSDVDKQEYNLSEIQDGPEIIEETENALESAIKEEDSHSLFDAIEMNPIVKKMDKIEQKFEKTGDLYLINYGFDQIFDVICYPNNDWGLTAKPEEHIINMQHFLTKNMLNNYNESDGILCDLSYDEINSIWFNPYTSMLEVGYTYRNANCSAKIKVDIIEEDNHQKINDINYEYIIDPNEIKDLKDYPVVYIGTNINDIILLGYSEKGDAIRQGSAIITEPSDEIRAKYPDCKIFGNEFNKIYSIDSFIEDKIGISEDPDACWYNVKVEWINPKDNYSYWNYYKIYYTLDNYKLVDLKVEKVKSVKGSSNKPIGVNN